MIRFLRRKGKFIAVFLVCNIVVQTISVPTARALTAGPTQPEVQSFQAAGTNDMVDLFTGDFSYNIPLFELPGPNGGYPFNLAYQAGITMDQEASWVGLGWNLQPGAMTRQLRGLPDEFKGNIVKTKMSIEPNITVGMGSGVGVEIFGGALELGLGYSVYKNSYKGIGYSIDGSVGFEKTAKGMTGGISLGLSLDSQEGASVNPSLSLGGEMGEFGLNAGYNSRQGLSNVSLTHSLDMSGLYDDAETKKINEGEGAVASSSANLSLAHPGYTPQVTMPMKNTSISATFKAGASWWGISPQGYVTGFYSEQKLNRDKATVSTKSFGYLNYQSAGTGDLQDFNREKDGLVSKEAPNLATPSLTYDIYSVTGQGIGMMYRPIRNDYGVMHDQQTSSVSNAVAIGADVAPALAHVGVNLSVNHSLSTSGRWTDQNDLTNPAASIPNPSGFRPKDSVTLYEPWYFKVHGESASDNMNNVKAIGYDKAMRVKLSNANEKPTALQSIENGKGETSPLLANKNVNTERKKRPQAITAITNAQLLSGSNREMLPHFKLAYITSAGAVDTFRRNDPAIRHHFAGYTALTAEGLRYVYALPAYNTFQEEVVFSAAKPTGQNGRATVGSSGSDPNFALAGTDKFLKKTQLPKYAHSFLLTSILGPDYVDVTNNGVTSDDLGYWVKFTYKKTADQYQWRDPFSSAHFQEGWKTDKRDDKGSFAYGKKELWYLAKAETKSHIADFEISQRFDGRGVAAELQDTPGKGDYSFQLNAIKLYARFNYPGTPIKAVRFNYVNTLCPGIENNANTAAGTTGKLTLKNVYFEYGGITRPANKNPFLYTFNYNNEDGSIPYNINSYDRWGIYKPFPTTPIAQPLYNQDFPYSEQDPAKKTSIDVNAAAWSLKEILLPSGSRIMIDYESDDYAYIQQKTAMQMMPLLDNTADPAVGALNDEFILNQNGLVRFKLEKPIDDVAGVNQDAEVKKYLDQKTGQLYFKLMLNLYNPSKKMYEYISGYADIDFTKAGKLEKQGTTGKFLYGTFYVKTETPYGGNVRHPFTVRAWQHLRTNQPELANGEGKPPGDMAAGTSNEKVNVIKGLASIILKARDMFKGFYLSCDSKQWGRQVTASKSWIRLNSPDKIKYGGGIRVKQITMKDQWAQDDEGIYGQIYDYTTLEGTSLVPISSGVAAYEPIIGGDENALHYAKKYTQSIPMRSDNNLFFEYPINESYYPGPQVGYSKVTVMSLPSAAAAKKALANVTLPDGNPLFPSGTGVNFGTSGKTVHEFYTAKEFPVITDETEKLNKAYKLSVPVPLLGSISVMNLTATQGYSIVTNDMHGRQKKISNYKQNKEGKFEPEPISWVRYNYLSELRTVNKENVSAVKNTFADLNGDGNLTVATAADLANTGIQKYNIGQETEFFHDMRQFEDNTWGGGARGNIDIVIIPILFITIPVPVPSVWPSVSKSSSRLRTSVSNKVVYKSGILESTEVSDGGSTVVTRNYKWDRLTGTPIVTTVNNNFDKNVFSYSYPAYREYQGMGAATENLGLTFMMTGVQKDPNKDELYQFMSGLPANVKLHPGDEILLYDNTAVRFETVRNRVVYAGNIDGKDVVYTDRALPAAAYKAMVVRSGYRNQLNVTAGTITALQDPSLPTASVVYNKTVTVPK